MEVSMASVKPVRVVKTKYTTYSLNFTNPDGRRRRLSVCNDELDARRLAARFTDFLIKGKDPEVEIRNAQQFERARTISLKDFFPEFMERYGKYQSLNMQQSYNFS